MGVLFVFGLVVFGSLSHLGLDAYDDRDHMVDTPAILNDWSFMFSSDRLVEVRPPVDLLFMMGYALWGEAPSGYHILQIVLHGLATILLLLAFRELGVDDELAMVSALFFFFNVAHFQAVHQITCMTYTLGFSFSALTLIAYHRYLRLHTTSWHLVALGAMALSIFSHPSAVCVIPFCVYLAWRKRRTHAEFIALIWPLVLIGLTFLGLATLLSLNRDQIRGVFSAPDAIQILSAPFWYLGRLFFSLQWFTPQLLSPQPAVWEIGAGILLCLGFLILYRRRIFPIADWALWTVLAVLPFVNYPFQMLGHGPSRQLYFASAGAVLVFVWGLRAVIQTVFKRNGPVVFAVAIGALILLSWDALKHAEGHSYYRSGKGYIARNETASGVGQLRRALDRDAGFLPVDAYENYFLSALVLGEPMTEKLEQIVREKPDAATLRMLLGVSRLQDPAPGALAQAQADLQRAFELTQDAKTLRLATARALQNLGGYHYQHARYSEAISLFEKALSFHPTYAKVFFNLGHALNAQGKYQAAYEAYRRALEIDSSFAEALQLAAERLRIAKENRQALAIYRALADQRP